MATIEARDHKGRWCLWSANLAPAEAARWSARLAAETEVRVVPDRDYADWMNWSLPAVWSPSFDQAQADEVFRLYDQTGPAPAIAHARGIGYGSAPALDLRCRPRASRSE